LKQIIDSENATTNFELVDLVALSVLDFRYLGRGRPLVKVNYDSAGHVLAGTLVFCDKASGKIVAQSDDWQ
jgi:hypothetical protein